MTLPPQAALQFHSWCSAIEKPIIWCQAFYRLSSSQAEQVVCSVACKGNRWCCAGDLDCLQDTRLPTLSLSGLAQDVLTSCIQAGLCQPPLALDLHTCPSSSADGGTSASDCIVRLEWNSCYDCCHTFPDRVWPMLLLSYSRVLCVCLW